MQLKNRWSTTNTPGMNRGNLGVHLHGGVEYVKAVAAHVDEDWRRRIHNARGTISHEGQHGDGAHGVALVFIAAESGLTMAM